MQTILNEIEQYARANRIPVVLPPTRDFIKQLCVKHNPKRILEVGTAIGFSASVMLTSCSGNITCCEVSKPNIVLAKQNFARLNLTERVNLIEGDCMDTLPTLIGNKYDLIFLDGPKGLYPEILRLLLPLLDENGILLADNVSFRGMVTGKNEITEHRFEKTVKILQQFIDDLENNPQLNVEIKADLGDGIAIAKWRK